MENLKQWILECGKAYSKEAKEFGVEPPKGLLLVGIPGTGKTLIAKACASYLKIPLLHFDASKIFNKYVGETESNIRKVIDLAESVAPCILLWDEAEKSMSVGEGNHSHETTERVHAKLLQWMQDKTSPVFVIATANRPDKLGAALTRKGRFDAIFMVDLPHDKEREEIWKIHIEKRKRKAKNFDIAELVGLSENFSGAEIEQCVKDALRRAFFLDEQLETKHLTDSIQQTKPQYETMKDELESARKKLANIAIPASNSSQKINSITKRRKLG